MIAVLIGLSVINIVAFAAYGIDKYKAVRGKFRISERTLLLLAAVGGSYGAYAAMRIFRHKTLKKRFSVGVPLMLTLHLLCFVLWSGIMISSKMNSAKGEFNSAVRYI